MKRKTLTLAMVLAMSAALIAGCGEKSAEAPAEVVESSEVTENTEAKDQEVQETSTKAQEETETPSENSLKDGVYSAKFTTDSSMFHVNEAYDNMGTLTVEDGKMTLHITMPSKNIVNLFLGRCSERRSRAYKSHNRLCDIRRWRYRGSLRL